jgi:hypothetical protein
MLLHIVKFNVDSFDLFVKSLSKAIHNCLFKRICKLPCFSDATNHYYRVGKLLSRVRVLVGAYASANHLIKIHGLLQFLVLRHELVVRNVCRLVCVSHIRLHILLDTDRRSATTRSLISRLIGKRSACF